jgi:septum formation protein
MTSEPCIVLASASPRRRELLERVGLAIEVAPADIDESPRPGEAPVDYARRVAGTKADTVATGRPDRWVLAADTVVELDGDILGKPAEAAEARAMLERLAGRTHRVTTAFRLRHGDRVRDRIVTSQVTMRPASGAELDDYIAAGEWHGKAGGYAIQGMAAALVNAVNGSITNVIGLPLAEVLEELAAAGCGAACYVRGKPA